MSLEAREALPAAALSLNGPSRICIDRNTRKKKEHLRQRTGELGTFKTVKARLSRAIFRRESFFRKVFPSGSTADRRARAELPGVGGSYALPPASLSLSQ
jgi:hypothetical protein